MEKFKTKRSKLIVGIIALLVVIAVVFVVMMMKNKAENPAKQPVESVAKIVGEETKNLAAIEKAKSEASNTISTSNNAKSEKKENANTPKKSENSNSNKPSRASKVSKLSKQRKLKKPSKSDTVTFSDGTVVSRKITRIGDNPGISLEEQIAREKREVLESHPNAIFLPKQYSEDYDYSKDVRAYAESKGIHAFCYSEIYLQNGKYIPYFWEI